MAENPNNRLQKFNGSKSAIRPESWIKLYDFENNSLKEDEKIKNLMYYLTDSALEWYADEIISNPAIKRWEVVKEKLIQRFGSYNANPIVSASHRRLKREESIENYFQDKIRLLNQTHLTKEEKIHLLTDGLPNDWKDLIVAAQPTDATKWFHIAASIEQNRASIQFKPKNKIHLATKNNDNRKNVCPFWCPICSKKGIKIKHWVTDCEDYDPNYKKDRPNQNTSVKQVCGAPELLNVSTLTNTPTQGAFKLINISVEVNGIPAQAFVDTGATVSIINWRLFKRTRLQLQPNSDIHISQADGVTRTCGSLQTKVRIDKLIKPVTLHVMKNFKYPLLIGLDVASLFNLLIDVRDKTIYTKFDGLQNPILVNHLEEIREHELKKLLEHNRNVFSQHAIDLGKVAIQHKIITKSEQPISLRPYRRPLKEYEEIAEQVKELLEHKLIRTSDSPWAFPVVMVPKKDGNKRMCIDYRRLNEITLDDRQPLPHIQDMFDRLHGSRFFSTLDVAWGYWQIEMDPQSIQKTAFVTNDGHYEFLVMPFGLKNAASTFQRIIQHILGELLWKGTCSFQDDILVYTKTWQEHIELLSKVFDKLRQYNMKLKLSKCIFGRTEVKYLGHIISHNQLKPDPGKVKSIQDFPRPDTVKKVRQFMGLANYYRKFVKDFSKISFPLVRLTRKNQPFIWNEEVEESFAKLKMALSTKPVLAIYNPDYPSKMECLAVIQATDHFHVYIENQPFEIITDHAALQWLFTMKKPKPKYFRWILSLSSKSCNIVHRSGKQQTHVDALSRLPVVNIATQELQEHQQNSDLSFLKNSHTHDGCGITTDIKNYVRSCKSCQLVKVRHEPTLGEMITPTSNIQPLQMIGCDTIVLGTAAANTKHKFIQVFVDHATRYLWAYPTITNTAQAVTQCLDKIIKSVNSINTILTDNGKNFISKEFNKFLSLQGIKHTYTSPYHPQCNGICEKLNDTIMTKLRIAVLEKPRCKWSSLLPQVVKNYNSTPHDVTGFSPLFLMYGIGNVPEFADQTPITIEEARKKASLRTEQFRSKWKIKHDSHHPKYVFKEGDLVIRKIAFNDPRLIKTSPKYEGPFVIQKKISDVTYDISLKDQKQARRPQSDHVRLRSGLISNQAYSITGLARVRGPSGGEVPLIRLRNPWGRGEWTGPWSERSWEWERLSERDQEQLGVRVRNEGEFWMSFEDFSRHFTHLDLLHVGPDDWLQEGALHTKRPWRAVLARRRWRSGFNAGGGPQYKDTTASNPQFRLHIPKSGAKKCHVVVSVIQQYCPSRHHHGDSKKSTGLLPIGFAIPATLSRVTSQYVATHRPLDLTVHSAARETVTFFTLPPGDFVILPCTAQPNCDTKFLLRILTDEQSTIWEVNEDNIIYRELSFIPAGDLLFSQNGHNALTKLLAKLPNEVSAQVLLKILRGCWKSAVCRWPPSRTSADPLPKAVLFSGDVHRESLGAGPTWALAFSSSVPS
ncbi:K02A2.6-like [Cordylochernes scorpioides]|uniref:RNA-directed DNA polymerase n=1 Tax=Cordylochernes scorpioides TaxID=51811 RepID=A0ABY6L964_9ARAC|nr:K02A2.6-like [Cordylochernes scorpioides]